MSDQSTTATQKSRTQSSGRSVQSSGGSSPTHLETEHGVTSIDSSVVAKIAGIAAREVDGVARIGGTVSGALSGVVGRLRGQGSEEHKTAGVGVEVGARQAAVDLSLVTRYPAAIPQVTESVRQNVIDRVQSLTGLEVVEVNIVVTDLDFPGGETDDGETQSRVE